MVASHISLLIYYTTSQNHPLDKCGPSEIMLGWHLWLEMLCHLGIQVVLRLCLRWRLGIRVVLRHEQWLNLGFWLVLWLGKR
jgi:hypothetical protein